MIHHGDLFDVLPTLPAASVDACVTDPPYGIGFMGREWDTFKPENVAHEFDLRQRKEFKEGVMSANIQGRKRSPAASPSQVEYNYTLSGLREFEAWTERWAREVFRVLKPGAYIVVCGAPRSYHRMACGLEDAGFIVRDCFAWIFGSGFPKNYDLGDGKGTALKPAHEQIALAWKPFKGTIKACHEQHGTAALNIDACRIEGDESTERPSGANAGIYGADDRVGMIRGSDLGRWPANVVIDEDAAKVIDEQSGELAAGHHPETRNGRGMWSNDGGGLNGNSGPDRWTDIGGASRFYYCAKPSREERDAGCHEMATRKRDESRKEGNPGGDNPRNRGLQPRGNFHPTVKPVDLMRWLVRLVTPEGGTVLDPFGGSFTTALACVHEHRKFEIVERELDYVGIGLNRLRAVHPLFSDPDALQVRTYVSVHSQRDAPEGDSVDPVIPDSIPDRSTCPDPCDAEDALVGQDHE